MTLDATPEQMEELKAQVGKLLEAQEKLLDAISKANRWTEEHTPDKRHPVPVRMGKSEWLKLAVSGIVGLLIQSAVIAAWITHQWDGHETRLVMLEHQNAQEDATLQELLRVSTQTSTAVTRLDEHIKGIDEKVQHIEAHQK